MDNCLATHADIGNHLFQNMEGRFFWASSLCDVFLSPFKRVNSSIAREVIGQAPPLPPRDCRKVLDELFIVCSSTRFISPSRVSTRMVSPKEGAGIYSGFPEAFARASIFAKISLILKPPMSRPVDLQRAAKETNKRTSKDEENETAVTIAMLKDSKLAFCTSLILILGCTSGSLPFIARFSSNRRVTSSAADLHIWNAFRISPLNAAVFLAANKIASSSKKLKFGDPSFIFDLKIDVVSLRL
mmetsp:Transcript_8729/g.18861  ORF Transcript_8729/g.18861 Transcript_8729/m.18861 type:complete len:243 (-) Transcript_8729:2096-2824(-)